MSPKDFQWLLVLLALNTLLLFGVLLLLLFIYAALTGDRPVF